MPTYQFKCRQCDNRFEVFLSIKELEAMEPVCPACSSHSIERLYSNVNVNTNKGQDCCSHQGCEGMRTGCCPRMGDR